MVTTRNSKPLLIRITIIVITIVVGTILVVIRTSTKLQSPEQKSLQRLIWFRLDLAGFKVSTKPQANSVAVILAPAPLMESRQ